MEDLINNLGGDSIGLNIVCEKFQPSNPQAIKTRKKKNNKYEKRRAKALRAKEGKDDKNNDRRIADCHEEKNDVTVKDASKKNDEVEQKTNDREEAPVQGVSDLVSHAMESEKTMRIKETKAAIPTHEKEDPSEYSNKGAGNSWQNAVANTESIEMSRKKSHDVTTQVLQDEEKRAQYLSTYHARPYEMDRKSGAVSHIEESRESTHIFQEADENGDDNSCPFLQCGLHPRIVKAITSDKFNLKRPTIIQHNAWSEMIQKKHKSEARKNLFVKSETGSGKTLAFFIPLLQSLAIDPRTRKVKKVDRNLGGTRALILCPTRELATQTYSVAEKLCQSSFPWLVPGCLSGGEKRKSEKARLRKGVSILIGKLLDI